MSIRVHSWLKAALWLLPLAWLWFALIGHLSVEWSVNPQYAYGWAVPFLCAYLLWRRAHGAGRTAESVQRDASPVPLAASRLALSAWLFALCALLLLPARLIQVANPQWRTAACFVALVVIGLTLLSVRLALGAKRLAQSAFALGFFLVAVPWPTFIEAPLIQALTRANIAVTIELLNTFGIPAVQHGNVIEVASGMVGIDDACSGIRSFQATLMLSLFFGELYSLRAMRRALCVLAGFALSFIFNLARSSLLTWVAARDGVPAIAKWHDPAGITILVACFTGLWLLSLALRAKRKAQSAGYNSPESASASRFPPAPSHVAPTASRFALRVLPFAFAAWVLLVFVGVELWFRAHERNLMPQPVWTAVLPSEGVNISNIPFRDSVKSVLRFTSAENVAWKDANGFRWQMIFLRWSSGRIAAHVAQGHNPQGCLTSTGRKLLASSPIRTFNIHGLALPFQHYQFDDNGQTLNVLYCLWQDHAQTQGFTRHELRSLRSRLQGIWTGRRNLGQRSIEIAVWGIDDAARAEAALRAQLEKLIVVEQ